MVTTRFPSTAPTLVRQDFVATSFTNTVHAAHCPSPQPNFVPVRSRSSRRTLRRVRSESTSIRRRPPFTSSSVTLAMPHIMEQFAVRKGTAPPRLRCCALIRHNVNKILESATCGTGLAFDLLGGSVNEQITFI